MAKLIYFVLLIKCCMAQELLNNPDFEDAFGNDNWICDGCSLEQVGADAYEGSFSGQVTERQNRSSGVTQYLTLETDTNYHFFIHFKLLSIFTSSVSVRLNAAVIYVGNSSEEIINIGQMPQYMIYQGWQKIGGLFYLDDREIESFRVFVQVSDPQCDYVIDTASLTAFYLSPTWKDEANERIEQIRKNDITINLSLSPEYNPNEVQVQLSQTKLAFPFGSAITHEQISGDSDYNKRYQDTFYGHFNWAVHENDMKWKRMEPEQYEIIYPDESVARLNDRGIPVRQHCMYWGKPFLSPSWQVPMTGAEILAEIERRNEYMVSRYTDKVAHWDVNNEQLHGFFYETKTGDELILEHMFKILTEMDPNAQVFTNDYDILNGQMTQAAVNLINRLESNNATVTAMGVQSHLNGYPDLVTIQKSLEIASSAGKPMWITELDVQIDDREDRADGYDDVVTLMYSDPNVHGILIWGFSDLHHWKPNAALFEGEDFIANAAGIRWQEMLGSRWRTNATFAPSSNEESFGTRGFYGDYEIQVTNNGEVVYMVTFSTSDSPIVIDIVV